MSFANTYTQHLRKIARSYVLPAQEICEILDATLDFSRLHTIADFGAGTLFFSEYFASRLARHAMVDSGLESIGGGQSEINASEIAARAIAAPDSRTTPNANSSTDSRPLDSKPLDSHSPDSSSRTPHNPPTPNHLAPRPTQDLVVAIDSIYHRITPATTYPNITLEPDLFAALARYEFGCFFASDVLHHLSPDFTHKLLESIAHIPTIIIKDIDGRHRFGSFMNAAHDLIFNHERVRAIYPDRLESALSALGFTCSYHYIPKLWYPHFLLIATKCL